jgi:DNA modification methylase
MCGDSTSAADVASLMDGETATFVFTSPPYAQQRDYGAAKGMVGEWDALMQGVFAAASVSQDAQLLVNLGLVHRDSEWQPYWEGWVEWMRTQGWRRFGWYVWDQGSGLPGDWNGRLAPSHEFVFHFNREPRKPNKTVENKHAGETLGGGGLRKADGTVQRKTGFGNAIQSHRIPDSVLRATRHKGAVQGGAHPAVFSVAICVEVLDAFTQIGELTYEPYCGSGTQIIAAEKMGRRCFGMDIDAAYVDVACRRWLQFTGDEPVHAATGRTFTEAQHGEA